MWFKCVVELEAYLFKMNTLKHEFMVRYETLFSKVFIDRVSFRDFVLHGIRQWLFLLECLSAFSFISKLTIFLNNLIVILT